MNWIQSSSSPPFPPPMPSSPPQPTERKSKWRFFIVPTIMFILVVAAIGLSSYFFLIHPSSSNDAGSSRETFSQYGMSIQYPSNAQMQIQGIPKQDKANSSGGMITWTWNSGATSLILLWLNSSTMNYNTGFNSILSTLQKESQNVSIMGTGNTTLGGGDNWQYQSYKFDSGGTTYYATYSVCTYLSEHRLYMLVFSDTKDTTLNQLDDWGNTFHG